MSNNNFSEDAKGDPRSAAKQNRVKGLIVVAVVAALTVAGIFVLQDEQRTGPAGPPAKASGTMTLGREDAPITVVEYSDFQCPYCGIFAREIQPQLIEQYVDTGLVRFEWRNFPVFGEFSTAAALGSYCADDQNAFWPYHDALYDVVGELSQGERTVGTLIDIAGQIGLDQDEFRVCLAEAKHRDQVIADYDEGRALNIVGTPSFTVNGVLMVGAQPVDTWHRVFEAFSE